MSIDNYHFGEILLGKFLYKDYGMIPYYDYVFAHGFSDNMLPAVFGSIFTNVQSLSVKEILYGCFILKTLAAIISFIVLSFSFGLIIAIFSVLILVNIDFLYILYALYMCLFNKNLLQKPFLWVISFGFISLAIVLLVAGMGSTIVLSLFPLCLFMVYQIFKNKEYLKLNNIVILAISLIIVGSFLMFTPLLKICLGITNMLIENSSVNLEAYGLPWISDIDHTNIVFRFFVSIWIIIVSIMFLFSIFYFKKKEYKNIIFGFVFLCIPLFSVFIMPYSLGRIDTAALSRTGRVSLVCILFIPVILKLLKDEYGEKFYKKGFIYFSYLLLLFAIITRMHYLALIFILSISVIFYSLKDEYGTKFYKQNILYLFSFFILFIITISCHPYLASTPKPMWYQHYFEENETHKRINGTDYDLKNIGDVIIDKQHLKRLQDTNTILNKYLQKDDSYLDLTNRNAYYFYMNRKLPIESGAFYNMAHINQHLRSVQKLVNNPPKLIIISADHVDNLNLSMRGYPLYRWTMLSDYTVLKEENIIFMLRDDIYTKFFNYKLDNNIELATEAITKPSNSNNLGKIPLSWGYSYNNLTKKMIPVYQIKVNEQVEGLNSVQKLGNNKFEVTGHDPYIVFNISDGNVNGKDVGLLVLDIKCDKSSVFDGEIYYSNDKYDSFSEELTYKFVLKNGKNIVPLDLSPTWLLGGKLHEFRFDIKNKKSCRYFTINQMEFFKRNVADITDSKIVKK